MSSRSPRRWLSGLLVVPFAWMACGGGSSGTSTSTSTSTSTTTAASSSSSSSTGMGGSGETSSSSGGAGGTGGLSGSGGAGGKSSTSSTGTGGGPSSARVRVVAANLSSGNNQSYDPGEGIRILQGIHGDLVLMQEMNYGADTMDDFRSLVDQVCGVDCGYLRGTGQIPNAVISRHPILESGSWPDPKANNRDFVWARIDVPGPVDLWAVSVHLLTSNPQDRAAEAAVLLQNFTEVVPEGDFLLLGGDFNTDSRDEDAIFTLSARLSTDGPYPADGDGNDNTSGPRSRPYDWLLASPELRALEVPVLVGSSQFGTGLVVDTRVYTPIEEIFPAQEGDSGAVNMQHMAVVIDYSFE